MAPPGGNEGHGQISIDTYRSEILNKTQVSDPGSLGPLFVCQYLICYEGHPIKNETFFIVRKSVCEFSLYYSTMINVDSI